MYWEPENEAINDDTDSEYNVTEEYSSEGEQGILYLSSSSDPECSEEDNVAEQCHKDGLRKSKRRKHKAEAKLMTLSGRCVKRRNLDEHDASSSRTKRVKKQKSGRKSSKKSVNTKALRPQRIAARNAMSLFSQITEASADEDEGGSEDDSSESEITQQDSNLLSNEADCNLQNLRLKDAKAEKASLCNSVDVVKPLEPYASQMNTGKTRLVLKLPLHTRPQIVNEANLATSTSSPTQGTIKEAWVDLISQDPGSSSANPLAIINELSKNCNTNDFRETESERVEGHLETSVGDMESKLRWGEFKGQTSKPDLLPTNASPGFCASSDACEGNENDITVHAKPENEFGFPCPSSQIQDCGGKLLRGACGVDETGTSEGMRGSRNKNRSTEDVHKLSLCDFSPLDNLKENPPSKPIKLRIKSKKISRDPKSPSQLKFITPMDVLSRAGGDLTSERLPCMEDKSVFVSTRRGRRL
ncbi:uncharacterized protein LOC130769996 [Actinidia eriantha]|uniref:uncharacterized protein LOC130769996 n=1 Tax=Actinidia eriantha TaxID=165200 RepID=UPI0025866404|nr:uncharacterized protein LOC130769996 [Actinidia eriantha]XP_057483242.1 uncharacterized protein LOC130769996 [Actinidia eriantha]XP_057483243.1 uncharacterized protein LOC130769996 [Actinidia eriantha]XP_057483244.1 uncharacterized protein LOC130769996 [Actinidia eriantha]XP_057483245.1 uncharacterized protein LOC130769996 [Actinidia eriantha]XP_057483246.1 uncharacterized protein LOC130769996 [Actinidia eriantha]XP_057483247.1 uncharacterized protein LOC130769996 [Actinidia eriantha]XP_0